MSYFWSFSVAGFFLPILLAQQGVDQGQSVEETYRNYIWICESSYPLSGFGTNSRSTGDHGYCGSSRCKYFGSKDDYANDSSWRFLESAGNGGW
jgi:hypothetical protein